MQALLKYRLENGLKKFPLDMKKSIKRRFFDFYFMKGSVRGEIIKNYVSVLPLEKREILISLSFDDGYLSHYECAKLLHSIDVRATYFVVTHLNKLKDKALISTNLEKLQEMAQMGHEIGSHGCTHLNLLKMSTDRVINELKYSKRFLEDNLAQEVLGFAYPYGYYNSRIIDYVKKFYFYGRGAGAYFFEDSTNTNPNRYAIGSLSLKNAWWLSKVLVLNSRLCLLFVFHCPESKEVKVLFDIIKDIKRSFPFRFVPVSYIAEMQEEG